MQPQNLLIVMSDEHNPLAMGCAGHAEVSTPHMDALAARGTRFSNANCASPICVPARTALATGHHIHEIGYWDNVDAYDGRVPSWHGLLRDAGHEVVSIGKLHYRGWEGDDYGFSESLLPMHIHNGRGEVRMLLRDPPASIGDGSNMLNSAKAGISDYTRYDESIYARSVEWLHAKKGQRADKPWVLMVSMVAPHFPLTVPERFFDLYKGRPLRMPKAYTFGIDETAHPFVRDYAAFSGYNQHFRNEADVRRALTGYYGLVSYMDDKLGLLLQALESAGLSDTTRVVYLSDHGDNAGARGLWGKSTMYRESVGIPLIMAGEGVAAGKVEDAAVSHIDIFDTVLDAVGFDMTRSTAAERSQSLYRPLDPDRIVLSEYHTVGAKSAVFMLQDRRFKYVHYCDYAPELFDLQNDPDELNNLAQRPEFADTVARWDARLRAIVAPEVADRRAKARQKELVGYYGGEAHLRGAQNQIGGYTPSPLK